jgi:hypothetical protein
MRGEHELENVPFALHTFRQGEARAARGFGAA